MNYSKKAQRAIIFLDSFPKLDYKYKSAILQQIGNPERLYECLPEFSDLLTKAMGDSSADMLAKANERGEEEVLSSLQKKGIMPVTRGNKYYPEELENTTAPPLVLYTKGNLELLKGKKFAIVGSRKTPQAELRQTETFAETIADYMTVVTGIAEGADTAALTGALKKKNAVCVLAYGFDTVYPEANRNLLNRAEENGLVITEYPPSVPAYKSQFPVRNRIIAGLSQGVLVVSAKEKSGALYTASYANAYGRDVFAFPYKAGDSAGKGCNNLIKQGAFLCDEVGDILSAYGIETEAKPLPVLTKEESALLSALREEEGSVDRLAEVTGIPAFLILPSLSSLEIAGLVVKTGADGYRAVK